MLTLKILEKTLNPVIKSLWEPCYCASVCRIVLTGVVPNKTVSRCPHWFLGQIMAKMMQIVDHFQIMESAKNI